MKLAKLMAKLRTESLSRQLRVMLPKFGLVFLGVALTLSMLAVRSCSDEGTASDEGTSEPNLAAEHSAETWTCSMHPQIRSTESGDCPICGMDLIPVTESDDSGPTRVVLSERARALARLRTTRVQRRGDTAANLRLLGRIEPNETTLKTVTAWTGGRIERLYVNVTGQRVHAGQVIATLYSPEVYAAHQDLLVAKRQAKRLSDAPESSQKAARAVLEAARERLRLLGVPDPQLARMEEQDSPTRSVAIRTPFGGTVIERMASEGAYVTTGAPLYRLADLSTLWVQLDAYESDLARLSEDQLVQVEVEAFPGETFEGKITFIDPTIDSQTRTARVRVAIDNEEGRLRPGMFAEAVVEADAERGERQPLVIPDTAPLFTGDDALVYVEVGQGERIAYEPRRVRLGPKLGEYYPVVAGLSEGERVVSRGAFAIDADLQIRGGPSMMSATPEGAPGAFDEAIEIPAAEQRKLAPLVAAYLAIQKALAEDSLEDAQAALADFRGVLPGIEINVPKSAQPVWADMASVLRSAAEHVAQAEDLETARTGFEGLSGGIARLLRTFGNPLERPLNLAFCPMARGSQGASWVQEGETIDNSYFGESMRTCGEVRSSVAPGSYLEADAAEAGDSPASSGEHDH